MAGNLLLIMAYALAPATRLAPSVYFQIVIATISGAVVLTIGRICSVGPALRLIYSAAASRPAG